MNKLKTILVDDEPLALEGLALRLAEIHNVDVVAKCSNGHEALEKIEELQPHLVFLDFEMPHMSGLELAQSISKSGSTRIIFVTAYSQYAVDAFELNAVDYLLKPINMERLKTAVARARQQLEGGDPEETKKLIAALQNLSGIEPEAIKSWAATDTGELPARYPPRIAVNDSEKNEALIDVQSIEWIDAAGDYMCIHSGTDTHIVRTTLKKLESFLDPGIFIRIHKSKIVNKNFIKQVLPLRNNENVLVLDCGQKLRASRKYVGSIRSFLKTHKPD